MAKILQRFQESMVKLYRDQHVNKYLPLQPVDRCILKFALWRIGIIFRIQVKHVSHKVALYPLHHIENYLFLL